MAAPTNMLDSAMRQTKVSRTAGLVHLILEGEGAFIVPALSFKMASRWAKSRTSTGNRIRDRALLLDRLEVMIARPGSPCGTRGSRRELERLVYAMKQNGFRLDEWSLPHDMRHKPAIPQGGSVSKEVDDNARETGGAEPSVQSTLEPPGDENREA